VTKLLRVDVVVAHIGNGSVLEQAFANYLTKILRLKCETDILTYECNLEQSINSHN
jgi:hypothetical protein